MSRPSESLTAAIGSIVGAVFMLLAAYGVNVPDGIDGPVIVLVAWISFAVTWFVSRRQKAGTLGSGPTGEVLGR